MIQKFAAKIHVKMIVVIETGGLLKNRITEIWKQ